MDSSNNGICFICKVGIFFHSYVLTCLHSDWLRKSQSVCFFIVLNYDQPVEKPAYYILYICAGIYRLLTTGKLRLYVHTTLYLHWRKENSQHRLHVGPAPLDHRDVYYLVLSSLDTKKWEPILFSSSCTSYITVS